MPLSNTVNLLGRATKVVGGTTPGVGNVNGPSSSTDNALARFDGTTGKIIQNGVVVEADNSGNLTGAADQATTTAVGSAFTNQPANDGIEVLSSNAGDTTQTITIIGTTNGGNTVVVETVTLNGTTPVATVKSDWGIVLAVKKSATTLGTVTVREASGDLTITAGLTAAVLSVGVNTVTNTAAFNQALSTVASGATTKQIGWGGTNTSGTQIYDSKALNGTTAVASNSSFYTLTEIYTGDVEVTRTVTVTTNGAWTLTGGGGGILSFNTGATDIGINGRILVAGAATGTGKIILPADTTSAGGITLGTDLAFYRNFNGRAVFDYVGGTNAFVQIAEGGTLGLALSVNSGAALISAVQSGKGITFATGAGGTALVLDGTQGTTITKKAVSYNGVSTAGWGLPAIQSAGRVTAQSAANASIATYTVGAADGTFLVSGNVNVTSATAIATTLSVSYTDEGNTSRTMVLPVQQLSGSFIAAGAITGTGAWESASMHIRCKASTAITIFTSAGTFNTVVYLAEGSIRQIA